MINTAELRNLSEQIKAIQLGINDKVDRNSRNVGISEINVEGSLILGTLGDIREILRLVSQTKHGIMSKEDKKKLDGIESGSNKYIHPSTHPADIIVETDAKKFVSQFLIDKWNNHNHHDLYYTKTEMNVELDKKSNVGHNHHDLYYTKNETNTELAKKANVSHGNHVPELLNDGANVMKFLHCNNVWREITPATLGTLTEDEINGLFIQFSKNLDWKESVQTFADIAKTYPNPEDGWTVNVKEDNYTYRFNGSAWVVIGGNAYVHPSTHPASMIVTDSSRTFVTQAQIDNWNSKANGSHGNHVPSVESANNARFLRNDNTWQTITPANIGSYTKGEMDSLLNGKANSSHGNHIPAPESANAAKFLRNDNTWQLVTPANIGAYTKSEVDSRLNGKANSSHGNHVPTVEGANNARFLRNDNTWQTVTPDNIGAIPKSGGTATGAITANGGINITTDTVISFSRNTDWMKIGFKNTGDADTDSYGYIQMGDNGNEYFKILANSGGTLTELASFKTDAIRFKGSVVYHTGNFDPNSKLNVSGGNMAGEFWKNISRSWIESRDQAILKLDTSTDAAGTAWRHRGTDVTFTSGVLGNRTIGFCGFYNSRTNNGVDGRFSMDVGGNCSTNGTMRASVVYNAVWNDYAELFPKPLNYVSEAGDIIALDDESEKELYIKATENSSVIVGCHSDEYGHLMGGDLPPDDGDVTDLYEYNKHKYIPIGLAGRVRAKCIGEIKKGDKLVISEIPGVARAFDPSKDDIFNVFGVAVEDKEFPDSISRVKMFIK